MRMIRKQVYLDLRHERLLKRRARQRGVTEAEIIREILDSAEAGSSPARRITDPESGRQFLAFARNLGKRRRTRARTWNRESLYEDRIGRWTKS